MADICVVLAGGWGKTEPLQTQTEGLVRWLSS